MPALRPDRADITLRLADGGWATFDQMAVTHSDWAMDVELVKFGAVAHLVRAMSQAARNGAAAAVSIRFDGGPAQVFDACVRLASLGANSRLEVSLMALRGAGHLRRV